ncbi:chromosome segregation protein SMC [Faecalibacterium langellae]|uniref:Chromosome segregation protein SMC n=1 Tax=Faecalibacterium langellae TaxID=3435293 RepID=A0ACC9D309_9FIRM|nr:chromosome segregation protein SMC [Faecalibacterium prausnitzii]PDX62213.1 chromosome segregation protein SMC [Faecalibacterium prausnitzii]
MVFKELEIQGFKSFPDKVKITFDAGVTGVVGPNGSGKSNLSDAVRWVLGETSSRQLRAAGKMEDVIFGGTRRRGAMGFASVRLTLDNASHTFDVDADEVTIGRKYYRSGDSEYTINGQVCRLKDVYELLLDTGIGRDGYSVIGQGRIAEIVAAKSSERREIFEEACGIAKYRYRKTEAERRLAAAGENLERLRDILGELESRVGPLEKESAKAEKFLELAAKRKTLEVTLWTDGVHRAREAVRQQVRDYETAQADYERFDRETKAAEQEAEEIRMQAQQLTIAVERLNGDIRSITEQISGSESRIAVLENDILRNEESAASLRQEIAAGEQDSTEAAAALQRHRAVAKTMEAEGEKLAAEIEALNAEIARLTDASTASGARKDSLRAELTGLTAQRTEAQVAQAAAEAAEETARQRLPALEQSLQDATAQRDEAKQDLEDTVKYRRMLEENEKQLANVRSGLELKLKGRKAALNEADNAEQRLGRELDAARQRLSVLRELEKNMDGYQNSVKAVMRAAGARRLRGVIGPVSAILKVEPGCEVAVETALGGALQNIVVENEAAAKAAIALLRNDNAGRATFLPLDTVQPGVFRGRLSGTARLASSLVQADRRYDNIVSNLLGRIIVVDDINEASRVARDNGYHNKVVTLDGQVVNAGGSFTGGSVQRSAGLFTRKQEMEELRVKAAKLQKDCLAAQEKTDQCKEQVDALQAELTATASEQITAANDKVRAEAEQKRLEAAVQQLETARSNGQQQIDALQAALTESRSKADAAAQQQAELTAKIDLLTAEMNRIAEGDDSFLARQSELSQKLSAKRLEQVTRQKDAELAYSQIAALEQRAQDAAARRASLEESLAALAQRSESCRTEIAAIRQAKTDSQSAIAAKEKAIREATEKRLERQQAETETLARARTSADSREEMGREMARLAERKAAAETEYDQTVAKLWDEYQLSVSQAEELCIEFESLTALRAQVADLRGKIRALGSVNVSAIEEYKEVKARYDALVRQVTDVEESRSELSRMISKLSAQMKEIFSDSFRAINENFGRVFTELFGGGEASLVLEDETDVLSCGIGIRVAPPGKVIKNLEALSGGEQALVAISIYFAILAVNPAPFCILDEIEAALDDANVVRFAQYLRRVSDKTQFIVITHRRGTMEAANVLYGVTMQEDGVSKLLKLDLEQVDATLVS